MDISTPEWYEVSSRYLRMGLVQVSERNSYQLELAYIHSDV